MVNFLETIHDSFELKIPKRECKDLKDAMQDGKALVVKVKATHGGYINGNKFYYSIDSMQNATKSWVEPFNKPVLTHHDELSDPIGRVTDAEFVSINTNRKDKPKGFVLLTLKITDKEAQEKILDGRYMTVSVGSNPASAICNICDRDLVKDGPCNHKRGTEYNDKVCYWTVNVKKYSEVSFVNKPADEYQKGIESSEFTDINKEDLNFEIDINKAEFYLEDIQNKEINIMVDKDSDLNPDTVDGTWTQDDLDMIRWVIDEMEKDPEFKDAKLTTEARKKLASNVFCGPNRAFPVNDCAHYTAAKKLIGRYKGPGDKNRIMSCIERRGKSLNCPTAVTKSKDSTEEIKMEKTEQKTADELVTVSKELSELKVKYETIVKDFNTIKSEKENLDTQVTDKIKIIDGLNNQLIQFKAQNHENLVNKIYDLKVKLGKNDIKDLKNEEIKTYKENLAKRSDESLNDTMIDLENEMVQISKPKEITEPVTKDSVDKKEDNTIIVEKNSTKTEMKDLGDLIKRKK